LRYSDQLKHPYFFTINKGMRNPLSPQSRHKDAKVAKIMTRFLLSACYILFIKSTLLGSTILISSDFTTEKWGVFELTVSDDGNYSNPFWDVTFTGHFIGPEDEQGFSEGFYYDSTFWKIRFSPTATGTWTYSVSFTGANGTSIFTGTFTCFEDSINDHGFIHVNPDAPHTFIRDDSTSFIPIGTNGNCPAVTAALLGISSDSLQVTNMWDSLSTHHINSYRFFMLNQTEFQDSLSWNPQEGEGNLFYNTQALDKYNIRVGKLIDRWFKQANDHGIAIYLCMSSFSSFPFSSSPWAVINGGFYNSEDEMYSDSTSPGITYQKKYVRYLVDRWGSYRNLLMWEYNNEYGAKCSMPWLHMMDSTIRALDNYNRPHTVSFWNFLWSQSSPVDASPYVTVTDDHLYEFNGFTEFNGDSAANEQAQYRFSHFNKPVLFSEFGSGSGYTSPSDADYERISYWGAFTGGGTPIFWQSGDNTPAGWAYNLHDLYFMDGVSKVTSWLKHYELMIPSDNLVSVSQPDKIRAYCFAGSNELLSYIHQYDSHTDSLIGSSITLALPQVSSFSYDAVWMNASTGDSLFSSHGNSSGNSATLVVPDFLIDILVYVKLSNIIGISENQQLTSRLVVYPNPSQNIFNVELPAQQTFELSIEDLTGRKIFETKTLNGIIQIDGSDFNNGIYFVRAASDKISLTSKLIKQ